MGNLTQTSMVYSDMLNEGSALHFDLNEMPENERMPLWRDVFRPLFDVEPISDGGPFGGQLSVARLGRALVVRCTGERQRFVRSIGHAAATGLDHIVVQAFLQGGAEAQCAGRAVRIDAGDIALLDLGHPTVIETEAFRSVMLLLPRDLIAGTLGQGTLHGMVLPARLTMTRLFESHLSTLATVATTMDRLEADAALKSSVLMLERTSALVSDNFPDSLQMMRTTCRLSILDYIDANLSDHRLTPTRLADAFRMSRATLYRLFGKDGGVAALIQNRRLDRCYMEITRPSRGGRVSISEVAYTHGFTSDAHFSRAFRRRFGLSPREARARSRETTAAPVSLPARRDAETLAHWLTSLRRSPAATN